MDNDNSIRFTLITGDYSGYDGSYSSINSSLTNFGDGLLMLNGNHDVYDGFNNNQRNATTFLKSKVTNQEVAWGDNSGTASYWYYDININKSSKLRIISVDSYDYQAGTGSKYDTVYSQQQVDWIVAKMMELRKDDYFIFAMHEPPVNSSTTDYQYNVNGKMDDDIVAKRRENNFCSARLWAWDTSLSNGELLPIIVNAYSSKHIIQQSMLNKNSDTGEIISTINCNYDFSSIEPATFLFYLGGHLHGDLVSYHHDYQNQLIILVDCGNPSTLGNSSDIGVRVTDTSSGTRTNGVLINEVSLDFVNKETTITRIGQNAARSYNGFPALTRSSITISFSKN